MSVANGLFQPIATTRAYEDIVIQIEETILQGEIQIGSRLPGERELAQQFSVSRVVVREAIRNLEARGIVEVRHGSGTYAKNIPSPALSRSLTLLLKLEEASILDLWAVRQALELLSARSAAQHATAQEISALRECLDEMYDLLPHETPSKEEFYFWSAKDEEFHHLLARASHNEPLATLLGTIYPLINAGRFELIDQAGAFQWLMAQQSTRETTCQDHAHIIDAIVNHDPVAAEHFVYVHLQRAAAAYRESDQS